MTTAEERIKQVLDKYLILDCDSDRIITPLTIGEINDALKVEVLQILADYHLIRRDCFNMKHIFALLGLENKIALEKEKWRELLKLLQTRPAFWNRDDYFRKIEEKLEELDK